MKMLRRLFVGALVAIGAWQVGSAAYIHAKAVLAQHLIAEAWSRTLAGEVRARPWPWADTWPVARLRVPGADVDLFVLSDATGRSLAFGPGLLSGSAGPGEPGHTLISAHRDTHFRFLRDLHDETELELQTSDGTWRRYRIVERHVLDVRRDRLSFAEGDTTLTLMTCYPFDAIVPGGPLRYAVIAAPTGETPLTAF